MTGVLRPCQPPPPATGRTFGRSVDGPTGRVAWPRRSASRAMPDDDAATIVARFKDDRGSTHGWSGRSAYL